MSSIAREFIGGPYDKQMRVINSTSRTVVVRHPDVRALYCKYALYSGEMVFLGKGTIDELSEVTLDSTH